MLKMLRTTAARYSHCNNNTIITRCMPFLHSTTVNSYSVLFRSQSSYLTKSRETYRNHRRPDVSDVEDAMKVFEEMLHSRPLPHVIPFNQILTQLVRLKHYSPVIPLFKQMLLSRIVPNEYTLSIMINCYCHLNQMRFGFPVLGTFFKLGLQPDVITFSTIIHGFVLDNQVPEAARVFTKMVEGGHCEPNVVVCNTLIKGFCKIGNNSFAIQLIRNMEERGFNPDTVSYSTIIDSLAKGTLIDEALKLFAEMIRRGIAPDVVTYTSLIQGLCDIGRCKQATRLLNYMVSQSVFPDLVTFNVLVDTLCKDGKVVEAQSVIEIMFQRHIEPDMITYNSVMDGYCLRGEMDKAEKVFDLMVWKGSMVNVRSCNILINGYCKSKNVDQAYRVFEEMTFRELVPDTITYTTLIYGFCKAGRKQEAEELFSEMRVCGLCNNQQLSSALELVRELEGKKLRLLC